MSDDTNIQGAPSPVAGGRRGVPPLLKAGLIGGGCLTLLWLGVYGLPGERGAAAPRMPGDERAGEIGRPFQPFEKPRDEAPAPQVQAAAMNQAAPLQMPAAFPGAAFGVPRIRRPAPAPIAAYEAPARPAAQPSAAPGTPTGTGDSPTGATPGSAGAIAGMRPLRAERLPQPQYWLMPGDKIPCVQLEPIVSIDQAPFSCVVPNDVWGRTGTVVLLEGGTRMVGKVVRGLERGEERLAVRFSHAETPSHGGEDPIVVPLDSIGADVAGRAGLDGQINTHFWERLAGVGAYALLDTTVNVGSAAAGAALGRTLSGSGVGGVGILNMGQGRSLAAREFDSSINKRPSLDRNPGEPLTVFVQHPIDFRSVVAVRVRGGVPQ